MNAITLAVLILFFLMYLMSAAACVVLQDHDNGKHKGWSKNFNNPGHQKSMNKGKSKGNSTLIILH